MTANDSIQVGFVGAGYIAARHATNLARMADVALVGAADVDIERARRFSASFGGRAYEHHEDLLSRESLDAAYVCVPPFAHGDPELAMIDAGVPFLVEKPLGVDLDTPERVGAALRASEVWAAAGYHWRYLAIVDLARELLADRPPRLALGYWLSDTPPPQWWIVDARSGGQIIEQTTHMFDLARLLVGEITGVRASGAMTSREGFVGADIFDVSVATLRFASGAIGMMASTCLLRRTHSVGLHLFGDGIALQLSALGPGGTPPHEISWDAGDGPRVERAAGDPIELEDRDFIAAIRTGCRTTKATYDDALRSHRAAVEAALAAKEEASTHIEGAG
jgi:predicted dehydrogenase